MAGRENGRENGILFGRENGILFAEQPAPAPHLAHPEGCAALRIVLVTVPHDSRSCPQSLSISLSLSLSLVRARDLSRPRSRSLSLSIPEQDALDRAKATAAAAGNFLQLEADLLTTF